MSTNAPLVGVGASRVSSSTGSGLAPENGSVLRGGGGWSGQALIRLASLLALMAILRGLARSATGIRSVSTPAS